MMAAAGARADSFGTFDIDFVTISGSTNPTSGYGIVNKDYRMGTYEITNDQWTKFKAAYGAVTGSEPDAYNSVPYWTGSSVPTNNVSWYEAAQFVNFLNTSKGYQAAYKFTGSQGTSNYTFVPWNATDTGYNASNPFRNSNTFYFLPTENEWVKAAYWNGTTLQAYATKAGQSLTQGNGTSGTGWNYYNNVYATNPYGPWAVGSGSQELNGTYDIMGNVWEWMENPWYTGNYLSGFDRSLRGGAYYYYYYNDDNLASSNRYNFNSNDENIYSIGFRIASIPEPASVLFFIGGICAFFRKRSGR
jgi:formylglycine-generating enzyme required for sulfatase activity